MYTVYMIYALKTLCERVQNEEKSECLRTKQGPEKLADLCNEVVLFWIMKLAQFSTALHYSIVHPVFFFFFSFLPMFIFVLIFLFKSSSFHQPLSHSGQTTTLDSLPSMPNYDIAFPKGACWCNCKEKKGTEHTPDSHLQLTKLVLDANRTFQMSKLK